MSKKTHAGNGDWFQPMTYCGIPVEGASIRDFDKGEEATCKTCYAHEHPLHDAEDDELLYAVTAPKKGKKWGLMARFKDPLMAIQMAGTMDDAKVFRGLHLFKERADGAWVRREEGEDGEKQE